MAALMVMCSHYFFRGPEGNEGFSPLAFHNVSPIAKYGFLGVHWFFMISGLVIAYSSENRTGTQFAVARASRLLPGAYTSIFILFLVSILFPVSVLPTDLGTLFANLSFLPQLFHAPMQSPSFWSIQIELAFYAWVSVLIAINRWQCTLRIVGIWLVVTAINDFALHTLVLNYLFITRYSALFCLGILLFHIRQHGLTSLHVLLVVVALGLAAFDVIESSAIPAANYHTSFSPFVLVGILFAMFALLAASIFVPLSGRWQAWCYVVGGITYPFYLLHEGLGYHVFWALHHTTLLPIIQFMIAAAISIAVAALIWKVVELPIIPRLRFALQTLLTARSPQKSAATLGAGK